MPWRCLVTNGWMTRTCGCSHCIVYKQANINWQKRNGQRLAHYQVELRKKRRAEILARYGEQCACCGETNSLFLTIDHINGGGRKQKRELGLDAGSQFYSYLRRKGYPDGYQILCWNCNCGKRITGSVCPHVNSPPALG